ncbi:hypothetical protein Tco_0700705 [Tanacetum coccineum]
MSTTVKPKDFLTEREPIVEWLPPGEVLGFFASMFGYFAKKRVRKGVVDMLERLTKRKDFKVRRGKEGITIHVCASGFGHEDLKFVIVKKRLLITGQTTNLHGKTIDCDKRVPISYRKKYDMRGLVAESKYGFVKVFIPKK